RLVAMSLQVLRKNGRRETVSMISNWSALWHHSHIYADDKAPLLDLGMRLGEGSGAALAIGVVRAAVACHNDMATFEAAGVSAGGPGDR
ncbi:MAG: nicotinate-nucleotide--dimethylbenzimidazole phosphoribosyltransferase, partial [Thalassobaculaceae bacterium]